MKQDDVMMPSSWSGYASRSKSKAQAISRVSCLTVCCVTWSLGCTVIAKVGLAGTEQGGKAMERWIDFVENNLSGVVTEIENMLDLSSEGGSAWDDTIAIASYFSAAAGN